MVVQLRTYWRRKKTGVIYKVTDMNYRGDVRLTPVYMPPGVRARETWKYYVHVPIDLEQVERPEGTI